jgi:hypothetical protein
MQVASSAAIIEVVPLAPSVPALRETESAARQRSKTWAVPSTIGRGQLIDLVV